MESQHTLLKPKKKISKTVDPHCYTQHTNALEVNSCLSTPPESPSRLPPSNSSGPNVVSSFVVAAAPPLRRTRNRSSRPSASASCCNPAIEPDYLGSCDQLELLLKSSSGDHSLEEFGLPMPSQNLMSSMNNRLMRLHENLRVSKSCMSSAHKEACMAFSDWLLAVGDGIIGETQSYLSTDSMIPHSLNHSDSDIITTNIVYTDFLQGLRDTEADGIHAIAAASYKQVYDAPLELLGCYRIATFACEDPPVYLKTNDHPVSLRFGSTAVISPIPDSVIYPRVYFDFTKYENLIESTETCDVYTDFIGLVDHIVDARTKDNDAYIRLFLKTERNTITATLWKEIILSADRFNRAELVSTTRPCTIALTVVKVTKHRGWFQLTSTPGTYTYINPSCAESATLLRRFMPTVTIVDNTASATAMLFDDAVRSIIGQSCADLISYTPAENLKRLPEVLVSTKGTMFTFYLKVRPYSRTGATTFSVDGVEPIDAASASVTPQMPMPVFEINHISAQQKIPAEFAQIRYNNLKSTESVSLVFTTHMFWTLKIRKINEDIYMTDGWSQIVKDIPLRENHFLEFHYESESVIFLHVYSSDGSNILSVPNDVKSESETNSSTKEADPEPMKDPPSFNMVVVVHKHFVAVLDSCFD
ncbi:hypothetical protein SSX86_016551 [Deinandra increscens subsp. villosa]|uniref:TF-B3 domain-containing protein n=1 Tax=Deinandra increscens subsp. villosa TaxID=3103831 RepID=A0AAP0D5N7_9ASTR